MNSRRSIAALGFAGIVALWFVPTSAHAEILPALTQEGATIAFLGDSITQQGAGPRGYVTLTLAGLAANELKVEGIKAGISGHKSDNMLARLERDVLSRKPTVMTLSCGVNDVWHGARGIPLPAYRTNITAIVERCQAAGIEVVILTATMIKEDPDNTLNLALADYNTFLRELAADRKCRLADVGAEMIARVKAARASGNLKNSLTVDGVHMNPQGNRMMAASVLRTLGFDDAQMARSETAWDEADEKFKAETAAKAEAIEAAKQAEAAATQAAAEKTIQDLAPTQ